MKYVCVTCLQICYIVEKNMYPSGRCALKNMKTKVEKFGA